MTHDFTDLHAALWLTRATGHLNLTSATTIAACGIPIVQLLADTTGTTTDHVRARIHAGKVTATEVQHALDTALVRLLENP